MQRNRISSESIIMEAKPRFKQVSMSSMGNKRKKMTVKEMAQNNFRLLSSMGDDRRCLGNKKK